MNQPKDSAAQYRELSNSYTELLANSIYPLWLKDSFNRDASLFVENLDTDGLVVNSDRRSMVQARLIYCSSICIDMGIGEATVLRKNALQAAETCIENCQMPNGSYVNAIALDGVVTNPEPVLYGQAFALFGLAFAFKTNNDPKFKSAAVNVVNYLRRERALPDGGFSEMISGKILFQSNPHMHLFEAAIEWMTVDQDLIWRELADELYELCRDKFFHKQESALCEHFDLGWKAQRNEKGAFIWEPGHHYEWAWLLRRYSKLRSVDTTEFESVLFDVAERFGVDSKTNFVMDEIWSDKTVKKSSSRVWPQCERTKAAAAVAREHRHNVDHMGKIANVAASCVLDYLKAEKQGLWFEYIDDKGKFRYHNDTLVKASSLYHILGALSEHWQMSRHQ